MNDVLNLGKGCCTHGTKMMGAISPFRRAIALEYADGLVVGVAQCGKCDDCWKVVLLDERGPVRVYSMGRMPSNSLVYLEKGFSVVKKPSWPIWVLPTESQIKEGQKQTLEALETTIISKSAAPNIVFATKHLINGRMLSVVECPVRVADWFAYMGLK